MFRLFTLVFVLLLMGLGVQNAQAQNCDNALIKGVSIDSADSITVLAWLNAVSQSNWSQMKNENSANLNYVEGLMNLDAGYSWNDFKSKRNEYKSLSSYNETSSQSINRLKSSFEKNALLAYTQCLRSNSDGPEIFFYRPQGYTGSSVIMELSWRSARGSNQSVPFARPTITNAKAVYPETKPTGLSYEYGITLTRVADDQPILVSWSQGGRTASGSVPPYIKPPVVQGHARVCTHTNLQNDASAEKRTGSRACRSWSKCGFSEVYLAEGPDAVVDPNFVQASGQCSVRLWAESQERPISPVTLVENRTYENIVSATQTDYWWFQLQCGCN